jgi:mxaK protein
MKRAHGHLAFALVAVAVCAVTADEIVRLRHAQSINISVAEWSATADASPHAPPRAPPEAFPSNTTPSKWAAGAADHLPPEARVARAVALSKLDYDGALAAYKAIIQSNREDLRRIALYDLGNLHLRQAIRDGLADEAQSLPLTELAKQSYRDLLRRNPYDWDARYNLERALRLAPEEDEDPGEDTAPPDPREHERSTIADPRMDLP